MNKLLIFLALSSCIPTPIKVSSAKEKQGGKTLTIEQKEALVSIDTNNLSIERKHYCDYLYYYKKK